MTEEVLKAFCNKYGQILLATETPQGFYELAAAPGHVLARTIDSIADMSEDKCRYMVPGFLAAPNSRASTDCILGFQIELNKQLSRVLSAIPGGLQNVCAALAY